MSLVKVLRLRPSSPDLKERYPAYANLFPFPESGYKGASGDVRFEIYFETKPNFLVDGSALQEFTVITQSVNSAQKFKQTYNNIDFAPLFFEKTKDQVQEYIIKDFIKKIAYQKLVSEKFSLEDAQKNSENYYSIVQDPWQDEPPVTRNFGTDQYFLTNGLSVEIYWHTGTNYEFYQEDWYKGLTGGAVYSNFDGSESWNKSLLQPGKTPPVPFFQDDADKQYAKDEKKKLTKTLIAKPSAELVRKKNLSFSQQEIYTISSNEIKLKFSNKDGKTEDTGAKPDIFPGDVTDLDILTKFVTMYNTKIPNYELQIANPDYYEDTSLEFKSPIVPVEESKQKTEDNKPTDNNSPEAVKFKLSVVYDKTIVIKAGQDLPKIDIYVGDPPTEEIPDFTFSGEEEVALDEEFIESEFAGFEEVIAMPPSELGGGGDGGNEGSHDDTAVVNQEASSDNAVSKDGPANTPGSSVNAVGDRIDITGTYTGSRKKIIDAYGWPVLVEKVGNKYYGIRSGLDGSGRNLYKQDVKYVAKWATLFTYKDKSGKTIISKKIHKDMHAPLKYALEKVEAAGYLNGVANISSSVYCRDTTNAPGVLSGHSFGVAMDFNSDIYGFGNAAYARYAKDIKDPSSKNYKYAKAIEIVYSTGKWNWGGNYNGDKDTHHFTFKPFSS